MNYTEKMVYTPNKVALNRQAWLYSKQRLDRKDGFYFKQTFQIIL